MDKHGRGSLGRLAVGRVGFQQLANVTDGRVYVCHLRKTAGTGYEHQGHSEYILHRKKLLKKSDDPSPHLTKSN